MQKPVTMYLSSGDTSQLRTDDVPDDNISIAAAGETDLVIWTDGQSIAGWSGGRQLSLDAWIELGHRALATWLANVPHLDTTFTTSVDMPCGGADGDRTHNLSMTERVDLTGMTWDSRTKESIRRKWHWLHLTVRTYGLDCVRETLQRDWGMLVFLSSMVELCPVHSHGETAEHCPPEMMLPENIIRES
ncbi:hypothetical protein DNTS_026729 [Danionella cerebrum]|uniref:Uncharacterized protein n=1 Tax=Danionella cerebrum TaxID=2873325 RepID=A0A553RL04_9TELE|nr:hypothetical protein DNTS_026729 [Danionella translucida]